MDNQIGGIGCGGIIILAWIIIGVGVSAGVVSGADDVGEIVEYLVDVIIWPWR